MHSVRIHILSLDIFESAKGFEANVFVKDAHYATRRYRIGLCTEDVFIERLRQYLRHQQEDKES